MKIDILPFPYTYSQNSTKNNEEKLDYINDTINDSKLNDILNQFIQGDTFKAIYVIVVIQKRHVILLVNRHAHLEVMIIPFCSISKSPISTFRLFPRDKNPKNNTISEAKVEKPITFVLLLLLFLTMLLEIVKYF